MDEQIWWVGFDLLESFMIDVLKKAGVPEDDARVCTEIVLESDKRGIDSHGVARFKPKYIDTIMEGRQNPVTNMEIVRESPTTAVIDGHNGMGQVIAKNAMKIAITKAKKYGMGMTAVRNSNHYGIAGYYCLMAAKEDLIGITGTNARPSIAPTFGVENMLGTNPLSFGMPTDEDFPFILDCATSVTQRGKVETYARLDKTIPEGWVIGPDGKYQSDPKAILDGLMAGSSALVPLGGMGEELSGYKGYGYATVVEILSAALQQGAYMKSILGIENGKKVPHRVGHFFMAIDIAAFVEPGLFKKETGDILRTLRSSKKAPGADRIYTAGEKEHLAWLDRKDKGALVDRVVKQNLIDLRNQFDLTDYTFPFD